MGVTGSCDIFFSVNGKLEPDYDGPVTYEELAAVLDESEPVADGEYADINPRGADAFSF